MYINYKERTEAYFKNMNKYENDINIHIRFLDKIFKAATDLEYSLENKIYILKKLLEISNNELNIDYKILNLCYCYKLNNILNAKLNIPIVKSDNEIIADICYDRNLPKEVLSILENNNSLTLKLAETRLPDKECLNLYNVKISKDHFFYKN